MRTYGQFCPIAIASEVLTERWTLIVVRELLCGSTRFNQIRRGVPLMSPSLLSKRLKTLEQAGVVERRERAGEVEYTLTPAGEDLRAVVEALGEWGQLWARGQIRPVDLDASLVMWDIHRNVESDALPPGRTVAHFDLRGSTDGKRHFWLVLEREEVDMCLIDPGHEIDVDVRADVRSMIRYWMGDASFADLVRAGDIELTGPRQLTRAFPAWFRRSAFAPLSTA